MRIVIGTKMYRSERVGRVTVSTRKVPIQEAADPAVDITPSDPVAPSPMQLVVNSVDTLKSILEEAETIAVVGCSDRSDRTSYAIYRYLKNASYNVIPVNPNYDTCHGDTCYPDLLAIPEDVRINIVNVFRNPRYTADMVEIAAERAGNTGHHPTIWTQLGVSSRQAEETARRHELPYVRNRCIMVEHSRLL